MSKAGLYNLVSSPEWEKELRKRARYLPCLLSQAEAAFAPAGRLRLSALIHPAGRAPEPVAVETYDWKALHFERLSRGAQDWVMRLIGERAMAGEPNIHGERWWEGDLFGDDGIAANGMLDKELLIFRYIDMRQPFFAQRQADVITSQGFVGWPFPWQHSPGRARFVLMSYAELPPDLQKRT